MVADGNGNLFVADIYNNVIRFVNRQTGTVSTIAGEVNGTMGSSVDGLPATSSKLNYPSGVSLDINTNHFLYIADTGNHKIRMVNFNMGGIMTTFAGTGIFGFSGDTGLAINAQFYAPYDVACDANGNVFIADSGNSRIRMVNSAGYISTLAGGGYDSLDDYGLKATSAALYYPSGLATYNGNVYFADFSANKVRMVNTTGFITTIAGDGGAGLVSDGSRAIDAELNHPYGVTVDGSGNIYIADTDNDVIRFVAHGTGIITTFAGVGDSEYFESIGDGGPATSAHLSGPRSVTVDRFGTVYIGDSVDYRIREVTMSYNFPTGQPSEQPTSQPSKGVWHPIQEVG